MFMFLTSCVVDWSQPIQQQSLQVRVDRLQSRAKLCEAIPVFAQQDLQEEVHFPRVRGAAMPQLEQLGRAEGPAVSQNIHNSLRVCYGLHQVLVAFLQQLFALELHLFMPASLLAREIRSFVRGEKNNNAKLKNLPESPHFTSESLRPARDGFQPEMKGKQEVAIFAA